MNRKDLKFSRDIAELAEKSPYIWSVSYIALPKGGTWSFAERKWQIQIMDDLHPEIIGEKPTQIGFTTISTAKALWFVSNYKSRAMYTLPRRDDVTDYTATTLDPMIEGSDYLNGRIGRTNTNRLKRIGDSYYHVMEASVTPRMLPVDLLVNDEVDMSDPDNLEQFIARLDASELRYHYQFSTPTVSGYGIDAAYDRSDMREWVVTCSRCNTDQVLDWEDNLIRDFGEEPYLACVGCKTKIRTDDIINGKWVAMKPGDKTTPHGYHASHLMLPLSRPIPLLVEEEQVMDQRNFYNLRLGKPWRPIGGSMPGTLFRDNAFNSGHPMKTHREPGYKYYLGADQGNEVHVIVGRVADGTDRLEVIYAEHIKPAPGEDQFARLGAIIRMFDIDFAVCDGNPNRQSIYNLAKELHGKLGAADIGSFSYAYKWNGFDGDNAYKVVCSRTDILDGVRDDVSGGRISFWGSWGNRPPIIRDIIKHCGNLKRDTTSRKMQGGGEKIVGVWRKVGEDHFAFALALLRLAAIIAPHKSNFNFVVVNEEPQVSEGKEIKKSKVWEGVYYEVDKKEDRGIRFT